MYKYLYSFFDGTIQLKIKIIFCEQESFYTDVFMDLFVSIHSLWLAFVSFIFDVQVAFIVITIFGECVQQQFLFPFEFTLFSLSLSRTFPLPLNCTIYDLLALIELKANKMLNKKT